MCGILGMISPPGTDAGVTRQAVLRMRDAMVTRGPDSAGLFLRAPVAMAHRRLAIRDLNGGHQPWISPDGQTVLVYNGELYNDRELRRELTEAGHAFTGQCDTEVVMAAYRQWGQACVERLHGMFALGIYDFRDETLFLARDRFGIKPLFLAQLGTQLVFASSIPAILQHPDFVKKPNLPVISHYLTTFRLSLERETVFEGIWQLRPAETLEYRGGQIRLGSYWDYPAGADDRATFDESVDELESLVSDAIQKRLVSDVPVGMFLSGGVDSSTIACLLRRNGTESLLGQCGGGIEDPAGEFQHARQCAEHVRFDYGEVRVGPREYLETWQALIDAGATPLSTPSDVILHHLARDMKKSVGVVLGGEGADELLCGYAVQHWAGHDYDHSRQLHQGTWRFGPSAASLFRDRLQDQYGRDTFDSEADHYFALNSLIPTAVKPVLLQDWAWRAAQHDRPMWHCYEQAFQALGDRPTEEKHARLLHRVNLESLLSRLDTATMSASLEARVPFTDHALVERMFQLPRPYMIDVAAQEPAPYLPSAHLHARGTLRPKRVLRSVAERLMPASLARRKKASFPTPVAQWFCDPWSAWVRERIAHSPFAHAVFRSSALQDLTTQPRKSGMWLWPLLNVALWGDRHFA